MTAESIPALVELSTSVATIRPMKHVVPKADGKKRSSQVDPEIVAAESAALRKVFAEFQAHRIEAGEPVTQEAFGQDAGIGSQGMVWQYLNGSKPLNLEAAEKFARGMGRRIADFSPRLATFAVRAAGIADGHPEWSGEMHQLLERALRRAGRAGVETTLRLIAGEAIADEDVERRMPITKQPKT